MPITFQLGGGDALGLWSVSPSQEIESFGLSDAPAENIWRVDLPDDDAEADQILSDAQTGVDLTNAALDEAQERMAAFNPRPSGTIESFGIGTASDSDAELRAMLYGQSEIASFGSVEDANDALKRAAEQFEDFAAWVRDAIGISSRLETRIGGRLVAVTRLSITGNLRTTWISTRPNDTAQHERAVKLMLASRAAMLRTLTVTIGGAVGLAGLIAQPTGLIRAVPAALKFIETVREEFRKQPISE